MADTYGTQTRGDRPGLADGPTTTGTTSMAWEADLPLLRSSVVVRQLALALGLPVVALMALLIALAWPPDVDQLEGVLSAGVLVAAILLVLAALGVGLIYRGRYRYSVLLDEHGVEAEPAGSTARKNMIVNALLLLSGRPAAMGAGLMAHSRRRERVRWSEVDDVVGDSRSHSVELRRRGRPLMVVACTPGNYDEVLAKAQLLADSHKRAGAG